MNFVLAAGGTGGHMIPAHALAAELKSRGHGVMLITDARGARFPGLFEGVPVHILPAGRLSGGPIGWLKAAKSIYAGRAMASRMLLKNRLTADIAPTATTSASARISSSPLRQPLRRRRAA